MENPEYEEYINPEDYYDKCYNDKCYWNSTEWVSPESQKISEKASLWGSTLPSLLNKYGVGKTLLAGGLIGGAAATNYIMYDNWDFFSKLLTSAGLYMYNRNLLKLAGYDDWRLALLPEALGGIAYGVKSLYNNITNSDKKSTTKSEPELYEVRVKNLKHNKEDTKNKEKIFTKTKSNSKLILKPNDPETEAKIRKLAGL